MTTYPRDTLIKAKEAPMTKEPDRSYPAPKVAEELSEILELSEQYVNARTQLIDGLVAASGRARTCMALAKTLEDYASVEGAAASDASNDFITYRAMHSVLIGLISPVRYSDSGWRLDSLTLVRAHVDALIESLKETTAPVSGAENG